MRSGPRSLTLRAYGIILTSRKNRPMRTFARYALNLVIVVALALSVIHVSPARAQEDPDKFIASLIAKMTPEAKVGQLFVVAFPGADATPASEIGELISTYRVGGVLLSTSSGNIVNSPNTPAQVAGLTTALQNLARSAANVPGAGGRTTPFIPLFIALEQSGNGSPYSQLTGGMTPLPSAMAIGATWKPDEAAAVGKVVGTELATIGVNLLIGPSLDVLDTPNPGAIDIGVTVFGGDPYWVGVMGQSYVRGLRAGSQGRLAAALTHFPGQGGVTETGDVVDRSLEELKKVELVPFLSVVQPASGETRALADVLVTSQMRYRGFTGNIRQRTAPVSVDAQAMQALLALPEFKAWRDAGGVLMSGSLGSNLIRRYYDPQGMTLPAPRAAQDALQAGNDLLLLSDYGPPGSWQVQLSNVKNTIKFFQDKYSTDLTFQARVDVAVASILRLKYRLYPGFDLTDAVPSPVLAPTMIGDARATTLTVAQDSLTLLAPPAASIAEKPLPVPSAGDSMLIFTDDRLYKECSTCQGRPLLATDTLSQTITRLYPGRVEPTRITSLGYTNLFAFLNGTTPPGSPDVGALLNAANWVLFAALDTDTTVPQSVALRQLAVQRPNLLANKKVIIFEFDAPYYVEPEVIARATAVYALYSHTEPFVEVAARALFGDLKPAGNSPVSVDAIRYQLITQTEPNPNQLIQLFVGDAPQEGKATPVPPSIKVGDTLKVRTGPILDRNGHIVPDGTQVTFSRTLSQSIELPALAAQTHNGVATVSFVLDRIGPLRVRASSEPAMTSVELRLTVAEQPSQPEFISPPTVTPRPTATLTATPIPTLTSTPTPTPTPLPRPKGWLETPRWVRWQDLLMAVFGVVATGGAGFWLRKGRGRGDGPDTLARAVRWALWSVIAGLAGYVLYGMGAPGSALARAAFGAWTALIVVVIFGAIPLLWELRLAGSEFRTPGGRSGARRNPQSKT
jgi:beta-N-acetylhexosaminidase